MVGVRKSLHVPVIRDRDRGHPPGVRSFYQVLALGYAVHIAHLGMAVQLDPFDLRCILALFDHRRDAHDALQIGYGHLFVERIEGGRSLDLDPCAGLDRSHKLVGELSGDECLAGDGIGKVRQREFDEGLPVLDIAPVSADDLPPYHDDPDLAHNIRDRDRIPGHFLSVDNVRVVRPPEPGRSLGAPCAALHIFPAALSVGRHSNAFLLPERKRRRRGSSTRLP